MRLLNYILYTVLIVGAASIYFTASWAQENTTATPQIKVSPPSNVQTLPNPNFQYLPQKAFVQTFTPEVQPTTPTAVIGPVPITPQGQAAVVTQQPTAVVSQPAIDYMSIISTIIAAGSGFMAKMAHDKSKKVQETARENSSAIVDSKVVQQELARLLFEWNKPEAAALNDSPSTKLESLKGEVKSATETATKA